MCDLRGIIYDFIKFILKFIYYLQEQPLPQHPHKSKSIIRVQQSIPQPLLPLPQRHWRRIIQIKSEQQSQPLLQPEPKPPPQDELLKKFICSS